MAKRKEKGELKVVSFKLRPEDFAELKKYGAKFRTEMGDELSPSQAARRLMLEALKRLKK